MVVVHCPIGLIPLLGCTGPASCELNVPYVCFSYVTILWGILGRQRMKERKEERHAREERSGMLDLYCCSEYSCEPSKLLVFHRFSGDLTSPFIHWSMLLVKYCPTSAQGRALEVVRIAYPQRWSFLQLFVAYTSSHDLQLFLMKPEKSLQCENP